MATIVIRNLDPAVKRRLQLRAARNGRSMEAEAREALAEVLAPSRQPKESPQLIAPGKRRSSKRGDLGTAIHRRFTALGGVDLQIPPRAYAQNLPDSSQPPTLDLGTAIHELFAPLGGVELPIPPRRKSHRQIPTFS